MRTILTTLTLFLAIGFTSCSISELSEEENTYICLVYDNQGNLIERLYHKMTYNELRNWSNEAYKNPEVGRIDCREERKNNSL